MSHDSFAIDWFRIFKITVAWSFVTSRHAPGDKQRQVHALQRDSNSMRAISYRV